MNNQEKLLYAILECGYLDLAILEDVKYDLGEIVEDLIGEGTKLTLNAITMEIFYKGQNYLAEKLKELIDETEELLSEAEDEEDDDEYERLQEKLDELNELNPEKDIDWFCNCLDTSIWFCNNEELWIDHLEDAIDEVEDMMGFTF